MNGQPWTPGGGIKIKKVCPFNSQVRHSLIKVQTEGQMQKNILHKIVSGFSFTVNTFTASAPAQVFLLFSFNIHEIVAVESTLKISELAGC